MILIEDEVRGIALTLVGGPLGTVNREHGHSVYIITCFYYQI